MKYIHYESTWNKWHNWHQEYHCDPLLPSLPAVLNFLCSQFQDNRHLTSAHRSITADPSNRLFLSLIRHYKPVSSSTIVRQIKELYQVLILLTSRLIPPAGLQQLQLLIRVFLYQKYHGQETGARRLYLKGFIIALNLTLPLEGPFCPLRQIRVVIKCFQHALLN